MRRYDCTKGFFIGEDEEKTWKPVAKKLQSCYSSKDKPDKKLFNDAYEKHIRNYDVNGEKRFFKRRKTKGFQTRSRTN